MSYPDVLDLNDPDDAQAVRVLLHLAFGPELPPDASDEQRAQREAAQALASRILPR